MGSREESCFERNVSIQSAERVSPVASGVGVHAHPPTVRFASHANTLLRCSETPL
jgi:hypothetical protein